MEHEDLTGKMIEAAYEVHNEMGPGFLESVYERCMVIAIEQMGLKVEAQQPIAVHFREQPVGHYLADLLVEETVIVELKSIRELSVQHEVQLVHYLTATQKPLGLLLNFGNPRLQIKRKVLKLPT
ncbi:MAG: GxxExxY protein [Planctomycetota bacterium]